nr:translation initiation factor IF-2-like isoform X1 [Gorilla gorilla gorilla]
MPLLGAGRGRGSGKGTAAALGGGGGCNVTHLRVRCVRPKRGPPQAGIFLVPPMVQGPRQRAGDCGSVPEAGREPAELGEGKQGPRPLPSPRGRAPAAPAAAGTFPLSQRLSPAGLPRGPGGGGCPRPQSSPLAPRLRTLHTHLERVSPAPPKKLSNLCRASNPRSRACCPRVQRPRAPGRERGRQGGGGGPRKVSGTGPAAREPSARSCAPAQPGSAPGRAAYQQNETRGDRRADSSRFSEPPPGPLDLPTVPISRRNPYARPEPAGQVAALARPRPPAPPRRPGGALPQSLIKKVAKLTLPKVVVACAPLSLPALYSLKHD